MPRPNIGFPMAIPPPAPSNGGPTTPAPNWLEHVRRSLWEIFSHRGIRVHDLPPWIWPPASAEPFNPATYVVIPAINATKTIISFVCPTGRNGVITQLGNEFVGAGWVQGNGALVWQLLKDSKVPLPFKNHEKIIASLGTVSAPTKTAGLRFSLGNTVALTITNNSIAPAGQLVGGRLSGWFYPQSDEPKGTRT